MGKLTRDLARHTHIQTHINRFEALTNNYVLFMKGQGKLEIL